MKITKLTFDEWFDSPLGNDNEEEEVPKEKREPLPRLFLVVRRKIPVLRRRRRRVIEVG